MNNKIEIIEKEVGHVIEIEETVPLTKMPKIIGHNYKLIFEYFKNNGITESKYTMPYIRYLDIKWDAQTKKSALANFIEIFTKKWHFQVGIPCTRQLDSTKRLVYRNIKNKKYLRIMHYGPYQKVGDTYKKLWNFAKEYDLSLEDESIEYYLNDPKLVEKDKIETEVLIGIK